MKTAAALAGVLFGLQTELRLRPPAERQGSSWGTGLSVLAEISGWPDVSNSKRKYSVTTNHRPQRASRGYAAELWKSGRALCNDAYPDASSITRKVCGTMSEPLNRRP